MRVLLVQGITDKQIMIVDGVQYYLYYCTEFYYFCNILYTD
jgi:hypothetical protein